MTRRIADVARGLAALAVTVALLVGVPLALVTMVGSPLPSQIPELDSISETMARGSIPDGVALKALSIVIWLAWAHIAYAIIVEVIATAKGRARRHIRALPGVQSLASNLIASCTLVLSLGIPQVARAPIVMASPAPAATMAFPEPASTAVPVAAAAAEPPVYRTQSGDSWMSVAEDTLGDRYRWREIRDLNLGRPMPDGTVIDDRTEIVLPGWTIRVPDAHPIQHGETRTAAEATEPIDPTGEPAAILSIPGAPAAGATHLTRAGDTLWDIAARRLGTADRWREIQNLNADQASDPRTLPIGVTLTLPDDAASVTDPTVVTVAAGDNLWTLATQRLEDAWDRNCSDAEIGPYWSDVIAANPQLGQPSQIYGGETINLPAPPPAPRVLSSPPAAAPPAGETSAPADPAPPAPAAAEHVEAPAPPPTTSPEPAMPPITTSPSAPAPVTTADAGVEQSTTVPSEPLERSHIPPVPPPPVEPTTTAPSSTTEPTTSTSTPTTPATTVSTEFAPETTWVPTTAVADAAGDEAADTGVDLRSVPLGAAALSFAAILAIVWRLRRRTLAERPPGTTPVFAPPPGVEAMLRSDGDTEALDDLDTALRSLASSLADDASPPVIEAVSVNSDRIVLVLGEADLDPPAPWVAPDNRGGLVWTTDRPVADPVEGPGLLPALVTLGRSERGGLILCDLEHAGVVSIVGDSGDRIDTMRTMALELAVSPFADAVSVMCIGFADELDGFERIEVLPSLSDAAALIHRRSEDAAELAAGVGLRAPTGRARELDDWDSWAPLVVFAPDATSEECEQLVEAARRTSDAGVIAVVTDQAVDSAYQLHVNGPTMRVPNLDRPLTRRNITSDEAIQIWQLVDDARTDTTAPYGLDPYANVRHLPLSDVDDADLDDDDDDDDDESVEDQPAVVHDQPRWPDLYRTSTEADDIDGEDFADHHDDVDADVWGEHESEDAEPPVVDHDWVINVLGPVEVRPAGGDPVTFGRGGWLSILTYLAWHRGGCLWDQLYESHWRDDDPQDPGRMKRRVNANVTEIRKALGVDSVTGELHIPNVPSTGNGLYRLGPRVITDYDQFQALVEFAQAEPGQALDALHAALELVRGKPFEAAVIPWVQGAQEQELALRVSETARTLCQLALAAGDLDEVEWAALTGLRSDQHDIQLHRLRLQAAIAREDIDHVHAVFRYYTACASDQDHQPECHSSLDTELVELYDTFRRHHETSWAQTAG